MAKWNTDHLCKMNHRLQLGEPLQVCGKCTPGFSPWNWAQTTLSSQCWNREDQKWEVSRVRHCNSFVLFLLQINWNLRNELRQCCGMTAGLGTIGLKFSSQLHDWFTSLGSSCGLLTSMSFITCQMGIILLTCHVSLTTLYKACLLRGT